MKKEFTKKKLWGSIAVMLVLAVVLVTLVGFGSKASTPEEESVASIPPTITLSTSPKASPTPKASPSPEAKATPKTSSQPVQGKSSDVVKIEETPSSAPVATPIPVPAAVAPASTPKPVVTATPAPTPKPKEKVWVVDVPASTQQIWIDEQGHWEDKTYLTSDWVYQCNGCGQTFATTGDVDSHQWGAFDSGEDHGGYTMVSGPMYEASEKVWVVDIEGHYETVTTPEQGHWEYQ